MKNEDFALAMFQEGLLCECRNNPSWDRLVDENDNLVGYELQHKPTCEGFVKIAEILRELKDVEN